MLFAASESAVTKKPRLRLTMRRSSSVRPFGSFHSAMSRLIWISCGIQWLAHADEVLLPRPLVLERHELVDVGLAVDDALVGDAGSVGRSARELRRARPTQLVATGRPRAPAGTKPAVPWQAECRTSPAIPRLRRSPPYRRRTAASCFSSAASSWPLLAGLAFGVVDRAELRLGRPARLAATPPSLGTAFSWPAVTVDFSADVAPSVRR